MPPPPTSQAHPLPSQLPAFCSRKGRGPRKEFLRALLFSLPSIRRELVQIPPRPTSSCPLAAAHLHPQFRSPVEEGQMGSPPPSFHLKRPDLKGTFFCSLCRKQFCHSSSLSRHKMQAHLRRFRCTICSKQISNSEGLRAHMASEHQGGRMFLCRCCNWAFRDKNELHRHLKNRRAKQKKRAEGEGLGKAEEQSPVTLGPTSGPAEEDQLQQQQHQQHQLLMANLWNNILLGQQRLYAVAAGDREGTGQEAAPPESALSSAQPSRHPVAVSTLPPMPVSSVIVQNGQGHSLATLPTGLSPSESDSELTIISSGGGPSSTSSSSSSSASTSSHNNSQTISPSQSSSGASSSTQNATGADLLMESTGRCPSECCGQCALLKPKLSLAQARASYLEVYNATFQNELVRLNAKCLLAEQCIRRLEVELREWRERSDLLRYRLLECRGKTLSLIKAGSSGVHLELSKFVEEMLKITLV